MTLLGWYLVAGFLMFFWATAVLKRTPSQDWKIELLAVLLWPLATVSAVWFAVRSRRRAKRKPR